MTRHTPDPTSKSAVAKDNSEFSFPAPQAYFASLSESIVSAKVTGKSGDPFSLEEGMHSLLKIIEGVTQRNNKIILIGNGGSAAIASHQAIDFLNACRIPAIVINDSSLITCMGNDYGYEQVFAKPLEALAHPGDLLIAISSSGKSANILNAVQAARQKDCVVATYSGFSPINPLRALGEINFYVDSSDYGFVEVAHLALIHYVTDSLKSKVSQR